MSPAPLSCPLADRACRLAGTPHLAGWKSKSTGISVPAGVLFRLVLSGLFQTSLCISWQCSSNSLVVDKNTESPRGDKVDQNGVWCLHNLINFFN